MLDLACQSADDFSIERLRLFLPASVLSKAAIFRSGSSFHFYSTELLTGSEWIRFLGLALLANPVNAPAIVDPRWVGHRLAGGFGGLRITDNKTNPMHITPRLEPGTI